MSKTPYCIRPALVAESSDDQSGNACVPNKPASVVKHFNLKWIIL